SATDRKASEAALAFVTAELQRAQSVARNGVISRTELETAEMKQRMGAERLQSARFAEDIAAFELDLARSALMHARPDESNPSSTRELLIFAPVDGEVLRVLHQSAQVVTPGTPLIELGDPRDLEVEIDVLSNDAVQIRRGAMVRLEHWGGPQPLEGHVRIVEPAGFTKISALGVEEQRVNVIVDLTSPLSDRPSLGDGFRVEARIVVWKADKTTKVPVGALFRRGSHWCVFMLEGDRASLQEVEIGQRNSSDAQVLGGLKPGDRVVLHPSDQLQDGAKTKTTSS
ncbi:MAG TPA: HlyD family efflux transporter periplasmic adaptor subunit, partial [Pirellulaceae bacterium]